jgi:hypothetical protein
MTDRQLTAFNMLIRCMKNDYEIRCETVYLHHGDCIGADAMAHHIADTFFMSIVVHPPDNSAARANCTARWGQATWRDPKPYLERNKDIVDSCEFLIACPKGRIEERRSGTWATVRYARNTGKPVIILEP